MTGSVSDDALLVTESLSGNRDAFGQIVSRYQSLICSLAYSATGSLGHSEDLAQETFITAWKHLRHLREPGKLRAWLCGIARNRINNFLRREGKEPIRAAEPLESAQNAPAVEPLPNDRTISNEEAALLWRSLERIPEIYREPLVLFYREHQSVETVATQLELSEDAVKQRLSRGRKLLADEVAAFVEGALERTNPGKTFTLGVIAALSGVTISAQAATLGVAAKGGAVVKSAGFAGLLAVICSPLLVVFGNYLGYRIGVAEAQTEREVGFIKHFYRRTLIATSVITGVLAAFLFLMRPPHLPTGARFSVLFIGAVISYLFAVLVNIVVSARRRREYYSRIPKEEHVDDFAKPAFEYRSRATFLGLPLVHVRIGNRLDPLQKPVKAWIAMANCAVGGLIAFGGVAIAPFSIGFCAVGLVPLAGIAVGLVPLGAIALGVWAYGGLAIGWQSVGCCAIALNVAIGNIAIARDYAFGHLTMATHINSGGAEMLLPAWYSKGADLLARHTLWINFLWITPLFIQWRIVSRRRSSGVTADTLG